MVDTWSLVNLGHKRNAYLSLDLIQSAVITNAISEYLISLVPTHEFRI